MNCAGTKLKPHMESIIEMFKTHLGEKTRVGVSFYDLRTDYNFSIDADNLGWAASLIKVPIMTELFRQIEEGKIRLEDKLKVNHAFALEKDDSVTRMPDDKELSLLEHLCYMITESDNESANILADRLGVMNVNSTMSLYGLHSTKISHLIYKGAPLVYSGVDGTSSNTTTANEMTKLFTGIYKGDILTPESCHIMQMALELDAKPFRRANNMVGRLLPKYTIVGSKCGEIDNDVHEAGAVNRDYVLSIMANRIEQNKTKAAEMISVLSLAAYMAYYGKV